jgi:hypothetical protein
MIWFFLLQALTGPLWALTPSCRPRSSKRHDHDLGFFNGRIYRISGEIMGRFQGNHGFLILFKVFTCFLHVLTSQRRGFCSPIFVSHPSSTGNRNTASFGAIGRDMVPILVGGWALPLWKIWKSVGMIIPKIWKNKKMFQTPTQQDQ